MPRWLILTLVALLAAAFPASALTLEVTSGTVTLDPYFWEPGLSVGGDGFAFNGFSGHSFLSIPGTPMVFHATMLTLNSVTYSGGMGAQCCDTNSAMTFLFDPALIHPTGVPSFEPSAVPFSMTGHLGIGPDGGVDLTGTGTLFVTREPGSLLPGESLLLFTYAFGVPEASPLLLLLVAVTVVLLIRRRAAP